MAKYREMPLLSQNHWVMESFVERMTAKQWKEILLTERDSIIFKGNMRRLKARRLGYGVVEVYKAPLEDK